MSFTIKNKRRIKQIFLWAVPFLVFYEFLNDYFRYLRKSGVLRYNTKEKLTGIIIAEYHVIEKGLTMPETRLGFGRVNLMSLIENCIRYINKYGVNDSQVKHAIAVIFEYNVFHRNEKYELDSELMQKIGQLEVLATNINPSLQNACTKDSYFQNIHASFPDFSQSRRSVRNYTEEDIPVIEIEKSVELARNAPSACNRQSIRTYLYTNKEQIKKILDVQGANRGFGHLTNKLIIVVSDIQAYHGLHERNSGYVDGGIFTMNLLYALHYHKIATCTLNCSFSISKEQKIRKLCGIKKSEICVTMITCGYVPDQFKSATSERYALDHTLLKQGNKN